MKKSVIITICLLSLLSLCGCKKESEEEIVKEVGETIEITFINETEETTDVWVLPDIEANRKTSIWGKAMIEKLPVGSEDKVIVEKHEEDSYLLRVIDIDQLYYINITKKIVFFFSIPNTSNFLSLKKICNKIGRASCRERV